MTEKVIACCKKMQIAALKVFLILVFPSDLRKNTVFLCKRVDKSAKVV